MRFGLFGSAQARRPETDDVDSSFGYRQWLDYNIEAEALGFHSTFAVEHHFTGFGQVSATLNLLTYLAARTTTLRLGTAVLVLPWHNPVLLAEQAATLDLLSGGRLDFGVGKGYRHNEFAGFCIPMEEAQDRFEEALELITKSWVSNERFSYHGKFWDFEDIVVEPPTAQKPHPPFWMGAGSPQSIAMVAERGYNLLLDQYSTIATAIERLDVFRAEIAKRGRAFDPMEVGVARGLYVAKDAADRDDALERRLEARARIDRLAQNPDGTNKSSLIDSGDARETAVEGALFGTPDEIGEKLERMRAGGIEYVLFSNASGIEGLRRFAEEVMPHFADDAAKAAE
ncbi:MAG: LLM class flavin-dependent oxidoreductase [Alphaproteobacteria bacterium]|jgi:alkanesulfonate monooxygenase SsuD/methylene tetrahydromethanopterin reductase-like flavin-dependent oxidoreductase (luciferase family)